MNRFVWEPFHRSARIRIALTAGAFGFLVATACAAFRAFSTPSEVQQRWTLATYQQAGQFTYQAMAKPGSLYGRMATAEGLGDFSLKRTDKEQFASLVDEMEIEYSYVASGDFPLDQVEEELSLSVVVSAPGIWQKEIPITSLAHFQGKGFSSSARLKISELLALIRGIERETGVASADHDLRLIALVRTRLGGASSTQDVFRHELLGEIRKGVLRWSDGTEASKTVDVNGLRITQTGRFRYSYRLLPNLLFADGSPRPLPQGWPIYTQAVLPLDISFGYALTSDQPIANPVHTFTISLQLENAGGWSKQLPLVMETRVAGPSFSTRFPLDLGRIQDLVDGVNREISYNSTDGVALGLIAAVATSATLGGMPLSESFTHTVRGSLKGGLFTWNKEAKLASSMPGQLSQLRAAPNRPLGIQVEALRAASALSLSLAPLAVGYLAWLYRRQPSRRPSTTHRRDEKVRKKYSDIIAAVREVPPPSVTERLVPVGSLEDLVKVAMDSHHPVLQWGTDGRSTYLVIDGSTRYVYGLAGADSVSDR